MSKKRIQRYHFMRTYTNICRNINNIYLIICLATQFLYVYSVSEYHQQEREKGIAHGVTIVFVIFILFIRRVRVDMPPAW